MAAIMGVNIVHQHIIGGMLALLNNTSHITVKIIIYLAYQSLAKFPTE